MLAKLNELSEKRDKVLLTRDPEKLRRFVIENEESYGRTFVLCFKFAPKKMVEATMHKMIVHCESLPDDFRAESEKWLFKRGMDLEL